MVLKESLDIAFHYLIDNIHGDVQHLQEKQTDINGLWEDLQTLVSDRFDELVALECDLEKSGVIECVRELNDCVESAKDLTLALIPLVGSSTLDQIKLLVSKYQVSISMFRFFVCCFIEQFMDVLKDNEERITIERGKTQ